MITSPTFSGDPFLPVYPNPIVRDSLTLWCLYSGSEPRYDISMSVARVGIEHGDRLARLADAGIREIAVVKELIVLDSLALRIWDVRVRANGKMRRVGREPRETVLTRSPQIVGFGYRVIP
jgi:hypothetical protein